LIYIRGIIHTLNRKGLERRSCESFKSRPRNQDERGPSTPLLFAFDSHVASTHSGLISADRSRLNLCRALVWPLHFYRMSYVVAKKLSFVMKRVSPRLCEASIIAVFIGLGPIPFPASASHHYTEKQLADLATRVGKTFWVVPVDGKIPFFLAAPDTTAASFRPQEHQSFEIMDLVGRKAKNPYYKVKFESGKEGYLRAETFIEEFNSTIVTFDPLADEKKQAAEQEIEERKRLDWIHSQPWSQPVKEAAVRGQVVAGMTSSEVKKVLGPPTRESKVKRPQKSNEAHWFYPDGSVLVFHNGILSRVENKAGQQKE
jgi:hypothetical protein